MVSILVCSVSLWIFVENICNFVIFWYCAFFSINVIFWLYCEHFSVRKGSQNFQKLFFILSLVETQLLRKFLFAFFFSFTTRIRCFLYAFRSSSFPISFALFLSRHLVMISFLIKDVRRGLLFTGNMRFLKGVTEFKLSIFAVFRDPISPEWIA